VEAKKRGIEIKMKNLHGAFLTAADAKPKTIIIAIPKNPSTM